MSPQATSLGFQSPTYPYDTTWPVKPTVPSQGVGVSAAVSALGYPWGWDDNTWASWQVGSHAGGGEIAGRTQGGVWCAVVRPTGASGNAGTGLRFAPVRPAIVQASAPQGPDDPAHRILWLRGWALVDATDAQATIADSCGLQLLADNGLAFSSVTWPVAANGGFGIFKRLANDGYRYASYSAAAALLEAQNLPSAAGWHSFDFIFRQAVFGNASTPWLTLRWDDVDIFTERAFGHALLPALQTLRANAHSLAAYFASTPGSSCRMALRLRVRAGLFHPDGYPQP